MHRLVDPHKVATTHSLKGTRRLGDTRRLVEIHSLVNMEADIKMSTTNIRTGLNPAILPDLHPRPQVTVIQTLIRQALITAIAFSRRQFKRVRLELEQRVDLLHHILHSVATPDSQCKVNVNRQIGTCLVRLMVLKWTATPNVRRVPGQTIAISSMVLQHEVLLLPMELFLSVM